MCMQVYMCGGWLRVRALSYNYADTHTAFISETIEVECDMTSVPGQVITIIHSNLESGVHVTDYEAPASYQRNVSYTQPWNAIGIIKNASLYCEQHFRFECVYAEAFVSTPYVGFSGESRDYNYDEKVPSYDCRCRMHLVCETSPGDRYVQLGLKQ